MPIKHIEEYRDPVLSGKILVNIQRIRKRPIRLMEVCGTHTVSIFRSGIRSMIPQNVSLLSGPGCPVCVTTQREIDAFIGLAKKDNVIITTFGDLMRVPGTNSSLQKERAEGRDIRIVYSTFDALDTARKNPDKKVVFLGVGFETTAPTVAASIVLAEKEGLDNFLVFSAHKLVPPALFALMADPDIMIDGFILPGHVSVIIGLNAYRPLFEKYKIPCVVSGFEPADILMALYMLARQIEQGAPALENGYGRAVTPDGNRKAKQIMKEVYEIMDVSWRGLGMIRKSGLGIRAGFSTYDAGGILDMEIPEPEEPAGCACGEILTGRKVPPECPLYQKVCTPSDPVGPCMVSSEGTCAAYYRYHGGEA